MRKLYEVAALILATVFVVGLINIADAQGQYWLLVNGNLQYRGSIAVGDGTVAKPAVTFASDPTTGWYKSGTGTWAWGTAGAGYIKLDGYLNLSGSSGVNFLVGGGVAGASGGALVLDAANAIALKNTTNAQTFRIYGTTTGNKYLILTHDGTNPTLDSSSGALKIGATAVTPAASGTRFLCISTAGVVASSASACSGT